MGQIKCKGKQKAIAVDSPWEGRDEEDNEEVDASEDDVVDEEDRWPIMKVEDSKTHYRP